ncbi:site-2 protease family protein [Halobacteriaceae archaeon GCM10025711]
MRSYTIGHVWGIPIKVNTSLLLFLPLLVWMLGSGARIEAYAGVIDRFAPTALDVAALQSGLTPWVVGTAVSVGLFTSVALHELGHSWVARRYGIEIESITLWIFGGVAGLASIPREWHKEFWIAVAGPATSVALAGVFYGLVQVVPTDSALVVFNLGSLAVVNLTLAAFNLVPAFPMDGGRILRALLSRRGSYVDATRRAARLGKAFALLMVVVGVVSFSVTLLLVALFVYVAATSESRMVVYTDLLEAIPVTDVAVSDPATLDAGTPIGEARRAMLQSGTTTFAVVEDGRIVGLVGLDAIDATERSDGQVADVMATDVPTVDAGGDASELVSTFARDPTGAVFVVDGGDVVGVVTREDVLRALEGLQHPDVGRPTDPTPV